MSFFKIFLGICLLGSLGAHAACLKDLKNVFEQGREYFSRGQFLLATQQFSTAALLACPGVGADNARLRWGQSLFELSESDEGHRVLEKLGGSTLQPTAKVIQAWYQPTLVSRLPVVDKNRFERWTSRDLNSSDVKSPWISGGLSAVLPGAGQVYNANYQSALFSFILNAVFLGATIDFHNKSMDAAAAASGMVFSVVYGGNIVGSVQSSNDLNAAAREPSDRALKLQLFPELSF